MDDSGARPSNPVPVPDATPNPREGVADVFSPAKSPPPPNPSPLAMPVPVAVRLAAFLILHIDKHIIFHYALYRTSL